MQTFNFPFHTWTTKYPESSAKVQFGRGYEFASKPKGPDQILYTLHFRTMVFFTNPYGELDLEADPRINMAVMEKFYEDHRLYEPFIYPHLTKGDLTVRFNKPLEFRLSEAGLGTVDSFTVELKHQP